MLRQMTKIFMILFIGILATGCASTKKTVKKEPDKTSVTTKRIETRFYVEDRDRVDQEMKGNFGYFAGTPQPEDRSDFKKTRKVYILEVTKNVDEAVKMQDVQVEPYVPAESEPLPPLSDDSWEDEDLDWNKPVVIPESFDEEAPGETRFEEYVVEEGDTLQKISKKFYDSYSQWVKIYEANADVLKDPNRIKPGVKIQIPLN